MLAVFLPVLVKKYVYCNLLTQIFLRKTTPPVALILFRSHMLYDCPRILSIWCKMSICLQLNILLEHVILGILCDNYVSESRNIFIVISCFVI